MSKRVVGIPRKPNQTPMTEKVIFDFEDKVNEPARLNLPKTKFALLNEFEVAKALLGRMADEDNWIRVRRNNGELAAAFTLNPDIYLEIAWCLDIVREVEKRYFTK